MKYGIIGSGSANPKVVQDGLLDITDGDETASFVIHARRAPQGAVSDVYDFLVDNELRFDAVHRVDDNAPKALLNCAINVKTTEDPVKAILEVCDVVLLLWDEENSDASEKLAIMCADAEKPMKDLTTALTPIVIESSTKTKEVEQEPIEKKEEKDLSPFSRDELMNMNIGVLRRLSKSAGIESAGKTKQELADALFYNEPASNDEVAIISANEHVPNADPGSHMAIIVWHENGVMLTQPVLLNEVKDLLSGGS